jgi:hypothetical protein
MASTSGGVEEIRQTVVQLSYLGPTPMKAARKIRWWFTSSRKYVLVIELRLEPIDPIKNIPRHE